MKKITLLLAMIIAGFAQAQNYAVLHVEELPGGPSSIEFHYCTSDYDGVVIYAQPGCPSFEWYVDFNHYYYNLDSVVISTTEFPESCYVHYGGCGFYVGMSIYFHGSDIQNPFVEPTIWKRPNESITLSVDWYDPYGWYDFQWSTGDSTMQIEVTEPGTYNINISDLYGCANETFSVEVRDNVEIYRSGVDPATNKNRVLWQTTPEQSAYVSSVKIERDGMVVGTVPYLDGQFLDNIGSENAARIYRITAIASDGTECPIPSYQFGTFNTIISPDIANPSLMNFTWEDPFIEEGSPYSVVAYRIGRFNETTGEFTAIDQLSAQVHLGKYDMDLFDGDYGIVAAVFSDSKNRDYEELAFSNRSDNEIVGLGEQQTARFKVYPNPAKDRVTIEGRGTLTVTNTLGQTILTREIDGKTTIELPRGMYFMKLGGTTRKIVVE